MKRSNYFSNWILLVFLCATFIGVIRSYAQDSAVGLQEKKPPTLFKEDAVETKTPSDINETLKSVQILSRILNDLLTQEFGNDFKSRGYFFDGCRGITIPGVGVQFLLSVEFPVHTLSNNETKEETAANKKDLWEKYEENLTQTSSADEGIQTAIFSSEPSEATEWVKYLAKPIDRYKVEKLKDVILDTVAKYGYRIKGLQSDQQIMVVVSGTGLQMGNYVITMNTDPNKSSSPSSSNMSFSITQSSRKTDKKISARQFVWVGNNKEGATTMIIQIPFRDLPSAGGTAENIKNKVKFTSYTMNIVPPDTDELFESSSSPQSVNVR